MCNIMCRALRSGEDTYRNSHSQVGSCQADNTRSEPLLFLPQLCVVSVRVQSGRCTQTCSIVCRALRSGQGLRLHVIPCTYQLTLIAWLADGDSLMWVLALCVMSRHCVSSQVGASWASLTLSACVCVCGPIGPDDMV